MTTSISRRGFLAGTGLTALGLALPTSLLTACSSGGGGNLKLWMDITGTANQKYFDDKVIAPFQQDTKLKVATTYYQGQDLRRLIQTALQAKSGPDVVRGASATQTLAWSQAHLLADLSEYEKKYGWQDKLLPWAIDAFTQNGKLWAMPMRVDTMLLYYNKTLFAQKGWQLPTNRDQLESLAEEAHGNGIIPFGATNVDWTAGPEWLMTVFWNHYSGPDALYQALTGKLQWTDPVFVEAVELIKGYFKKGWFGGGTDKYFSVPSQQMGASFGTGKVAMFPQGEWWMSAVGAVLRQEGQQHERVGLGALPGPARRGRVPPIRTGHRRLARHQRGQQEQGPRRRIPQLVLHEPPAGAAAHGRRAGDLQHPDPGQRLRHPEQHRPALQAAADRAEQGGRQRRLRLRDVDLVAGEVRRVRLPGPGEGADRQDERQGLLRPAEQPVPAGGQGRQPCRRSSSADRASDRRSGATGPRAGRRRRVTAADPAPPPLAPRAHRLGVHAAADRGERPGRTRPVDRHRVLLADRLDRTRPGVIHWPGQLSARVRRLGVPRGVAAQLRVARAVPRRAGRARPARLVPAHPDRAVPDPVPDDLLHPLRRGQRGQRRRVAEPAQPHHAASARISASTQRSSATRPRR